MSDTRIVFMGTPEFAAIALDELNNHGIDVALVVTAPDKSIGRGQKVAPPAVKVMAQKLGLPLLQPQKIRSPEFLANVASVTPDFIIVVSYGRILPPQLLAIPRYVPINLHPSLLPKYRGAAPINWAIINGEREVGLSTFKMNDQLDAGDIYLQESFPLEFGKPADEVLMSLAQPSAEILLKTMSQIKSGTLQPYPQDASKVTFAPLLRKEMGLIDWNESAQMIANKTYGLAPWPGVFTFFRGKRIKIIEASPASGSGSEIGTIAPETTKDRLSITTGSGVLLITRLQPENARVMDARSFSIGYKPLIGEKFSSQPIS